MTDEELKAAILTEARNILSSKEKWTQGADARNAAGDSTDLYGSDAVCFCLLSACLLARQRITGVGSRMSSLSWLHDRHHERFPDWPRDSVDAWNDHPATTYEDVIAFLTE